MTDEYTYSIESYHADEDTELIYTINAEDTRGQITDLNAEGNPIFTIDDLEEWIRCLYDERYYNKDVEASLLEAASDLR